MNKRGSWVLWVSIGILIVLIVGIFLYFALWKPNYDKVYAAKVYSGALFNPVGNLSNEEALLKFDESFVYYLLYEIKAYNLHNPPLSGNKPKIGFFIGEDPYNAVINNGDILVSKGVIDSKDAIITTTKEEAIKMLRDKEYIKTSFSSGTSKIELIASKSILFAKGYLNLYSELTGKGVTGNVVKIYLD